ncbi:MAG: threonylcarbamoyladenosine tRNA methylthiotransferase, partial [Euryarchaeota archaeon]|nr:threonylcarbamoyladenosine tRNA methylthiotransferase [Euryarchaeota archaeon]
MRVYFSTYGCTMNQGDTEVLKALVAEKHEIVESPEECDAVVVNSCAVVETTERKVLKEVRWHKRQG